MEGERESEKEKEKERERERERETHSHYSMHPGVIMQRHCFVRFYQENAQTELRALVYFHTG